MIKLVVSDLDGTLLTKSQTISIKNQEAIKKLKDHDIQFAIASGRDHEGAFSVLDKYHICCEGILGNGAQYVDENGNVLKECYMDHSILKDIFDIFHSDHIPFMIFTTTGFYTTYKGDYVREQFIKRNIIRFNNKREDYFGNGVNANSPCMQLKYIEDIDTFIKSDLDIIKVEGFYYDETKMIETKNKLKNVKNIAYLSSFFDNVEVTAPNAQKGLILEEVCKLKGINKDEVAILGDGMNDLTLFEHFKYSFAPSNAVDEIKSLAYNISELDCYQDSFASQIEIILKL